MLCRLERRADLVCLARAQRRGCDLGCLVLVDGELAGDLARIEGECCELGAIRAPPLDRRRGGRALVGQAAVRVEQVALAALVEQALLLVLAVDLDERSGDLGEARRGDGLVVDPGRRAARRGDLADADQRLRVAIEQRLHARRVGAVAHETRVRACARARGPAHR